MRNKIDKFRQKILDQNADIHTQQTEIGVVSERANLLEQSLATVLLQQNKVKAQVCAAFFHPF